MAGADCTGIVDPAGHIEGVTAACDLVGGSCISWAVVKGSRTVGCTSCLAPGPIADFVDK